MDLTLFCPVQYSYLVPVSLVRLLFDMATASFPDIYSVPHQPTNITFPKRSFGKKVVALCTFQASWFSTWKWIHYDETNDKAFCFYCVKGFKENKLKAPNADQAFVSFIITHSAKTMQMISISF